VVCPSEHHGLIREGEVKTDDVAHFFDKARIRGKVEGAAQARLQAKCSSGAVDEIRSHLQVASQRTHAPMGHIVRLSIQRCIDDCLSRLDVVWTWLARARRIAETFQLLRRESPTSFRDRLLQ